jgi:hypothetical protein
MSYIPQWVLPSEAGEEENMVNGAIIRSEWLIEFRPSSTRSRKPSFHPKTKSSHPANQAEEAGVFV